MAKLRRIETIKSKIDRVLGNLSEMARLNIKLKAVKKAAGISEIEKDSKYEKEIVQADLLENLSTSIKSIIIPVSWKEDDKEKSATVNISQGFKIDAKKVFKKMDIEAFVSICSITEKALKESGFTDEEIANFKYVDGYKITVADKKTREIKVERG